MASGGSVAAPGLIFMIARTLSARRASAPVLNLWTRTLLNKLDNLKFVSYVGADGYPVVVPAIQAQAAGAGHVLFSTGAYKRDLEAIPSGATVALFGMSLDMEDVLMRGEFQGIRRVGGIRCGRVAVNWVYNPMPPKPLQIYPPVVVKPVTIF